MKLPLPGIGYGLTISLLLARWMQQLLFQARPADPLPFPLVSILLLSLALSACGVPARRTAKGDPLSALSSL